MLTNLTGSDLGPISTEDPYIYSYWYKKVISSTHNKMMVEFRADEIDATEGKR